MSFRQLEGRDRVSDPGLLFALKSGSRAEAMLPEALDAPAAPLQPSDHATSGWHRGQTETLVELLDGRPALAGQEAQRLRLLGRHALSPFLHTGTEFPTIAPSYPYAAQKASNPDWSCRK